MIYIGSDSKSRIFSDVESAYPNECYGFIFGVEDSNGNRTVTEVAYIMPGINGDERKQFSITEEEFASSAKYAEDHGLKFLGLYHSHPDTEAVPENSEKVQADNELSYLLVSVQDGKVSSIRCWRFNGTDLKEELISDKPFA